MRFCQRSKHGDKFILKFRMFVLEILASKISRNFGILYFGEMLVKKKKTVEKIQKDSPRKNKENPSSRLIELVFGSYVVI